MDKKYNDPRFNRPLIKIPRLIAAIMGFDVAALFAPRIGLISGYFLPVELELLLTAAGAVLFVWAIRGVYEKPSKT
jgi:membrane protein implicated in regulation of membrane protease activity